MMKGVRERAISSFNYELLIEIDQVRDDVSEVGSVGRRRTSCGVPTAMSSGSRARSEALSDSITLPHICASLLSHSK